MADGDVLGIVIFSVIFALGATAIGPKAKPVIAWCQSLSDIMFRFTEYVMKFAPIGVGAAMAYTVGHNEQGLGVLFYLGKLVLTLYGSLVAFAVLVLLPIALDIQGAAKGFFQRRKNACLDRVCDDIKRICPAEGDGKPCPSWRAAPDRRFRFAYRLQL